MLLLSLVVMALVQFTQALFRLRGRNLLVGISALIESEGLGETLKDPASKRKLSPKAHANHAAEVLNVTGAARLRPETNPNSVMNVVRGPAASWVEPKDLARAIKQRQDSAKVTAVAAKSRASNVGVLASEAQLVPDEDDLAAKFKALEPAMTER